MTIMKISLVCFVISITIGYAQQTKIPDFSITTLKGKTYTSENTKDYVVVLNFWRTSCKPCVREMPELNQLVRKYRRKKVLFLGVAYNDENQLATFLKKHKFRYEIVSQETAKTFMYKYHRRSSEGFKMLPAHAVLNKKGEFVLEAQESGTSIIQRMDQVIKDLL